MAELKTKVESIIHYYFPGSEVILEDVPLSDKISGYIVWEGFQEFLGYERQQRLRAALRQGLNREEELRLSMLLTFVPAELHAIREAA